jgi:hypothetical protein
LLWGRGSGFDSRVNDLLSAMTIPCVLRVWTSCSVVLRTKVFATGDFAFELFWLRRPIRQLVR